MKQGIQRIASFAMMPLGHDGPRLEQSGVPSRALRFAAGPETRFHEWPSEPTEVRFVRSGGGQRDVTGQGSP